MYYITPEQMKQLEKASNDNGISYYQLMLNAGEKLAGFILSMPCDLSHGIVFFCGNGNNGGDGFIAAKLVSESGYPVTVVLMCGDPVTESATKAYFELSGTSVDVLNLYDNNDIIFSKLAAASLIVDSVFGTGYHGDLPPQVKACFSFATRSGAKKLAVDCPSGCDCLNGNVADGTMMCDYTVTFANRKIGMEFYPMKEYCGKIFEADIGILKICYKSVTRLIMRADMEFMKKIINVRSPRTHKGNYGHLLNIAGSKTMPGAAALSTLSALRSGVGLCTLASTKSVTELHASSIYEAMYLPLKENTAGCISASNEKEILKACKNSDAIAFGCGLGKSEDSFELLKAILKNVSCPVIIDADGLNCIGTNIDIFKDTRASIIITPHVAELARLLGISTAEVTEDRYNLVTKLSDEYGITVVSKGTPNIIAGSNGFSFISDSGNAGLARGGSGDTLTGIIAAFAAQGLTTTEAAVAGSYLFGLAADRVSDKLSMQGMLPSDVINELPLLFKDMNR